MDLAMAQEYEMTKDENGNVPRELLFAALEQMNASNKTLAAVPNINWTSLGPNNQAGRSKSMMVDRNDLSGNTVFCGSVGGGLWRTTNINTASPNWQPVNDFMQNLSITGISQDLTNLNVMYASTGEPYGGLASIRGLGVFKSIDGGITWNPLPATSGSDFYQCAKLFVGPTGTVFVATTQGIFRSADAGLTFTKVLSSASAGASSNTGHDVEQAANGDIYGSLDGSLHRSTDNGVTWVAVPLGFTTQRIEIACAPSNTNTIYLLTEDNNAVDLIRKSTNGGTSWTTIAKPVDSDNGIPANDFSRGQAWYDLCIAVDPNNDNVVYVGGIDLFKTTNGGTSWTQVSHWYGGFGHQYVHADQHNIVFAPGSSSVVYFNNDGGIYRTQNGNAAVPTIADKGTNLITLQLYGCAADPIAAYYLGGAQDNGSHQYTANTMQGTVEVTSGDGAYCNIDQNEPNYQFTQYIYNQYRVSDDGGNSFSPVNLGSSTGRFINPSDYDNVNNKMYASTNTGRYKRWDNPQTGNNDIDVNVAVMSGKVSAVKVSPNVNNQVYFGDDDGNVYRISNAHTNTPIATNISTGLPNNKYVSCVEVQKGNENHLLVTYSNYTTSSVWESTNGGGSWTEVEGNLPDMPVRWAVFNPKNPTQVFLATELGVWSTDVLNGTNTNWGPTNTGLANVRVDMIEINSNDQMIAATHGRGMYFTNSLNVVINIPVTSITVMGLGNVSTISVPAGSLQMVATVLPVTATNPAVSWSVTPGTGSGTINASGVLTAQTDGTVTVTATATDGSNVSGSTVITISNQSPALVDSIDVYGQGRIFTIATVQGQLQMIADIYPLNATITNVIWNMQPGGTGAAAITTSGMLTALANGTVIVEANATDGSNVKGSAVITITGQQALSSADIELENVTLYPNPSNGILSLSAAETVNNITVYTMSGQFVKKYNANKTIDLSNLPKASYITVIKMKTAKQKSQIVNLR